MVHIIQKSTSYTKEQLLFEEKCQDAWGIGESLSFLKKKNPLTKFGFYAGNFDDLTPADCVFLQLCRSTCDLLIVGVASNYSMSLQGKQFRYTTDERVFRLGCLGAVNYLTIYDEETPHLTVDKLSPDYIFSGRIQDDDKPFQGALYKNKVHFIEYPWVHERTENKWFKT